MTFGKLYRPSTYVPPVDGDFALCGACIEAPTTDCPLPPFQWEAQTPAVIEANTTALVEEANANLDRVAAAIEPLSFEKVILPLMTPPNYKTVTLLIEGLVERIAL